jgi:hypothetical protein
MESRGILLDTTDTVVNGEGSVSFVDESLNLTLRPKPKDMSLLSLRSPLHIRGTFGQPKAAPDMGALAGRAALALGLAAINPLLGLAATFEPGPGQGAGRAGTLKPSGSGGCARARSVGACTLLGCLLPCSDRDALPQ